MLRDQLSVRDYGHLALLAKYEVSRHMPALLETWVRDFPDEDIEDLCFVVDYVTNPPSIFMEYPPKSDWHENVSITDELLNIATESPTLDSEKVAVIRLAPVCNLWPSWRYSTMRLVDMDKTADRHSRDPRLVAILEAGKREGGKSREPCHVGHWKNASESAPVEAEYDIIDELIRRVNIYDFDVGTVRFRTFASKIENEARQLLEELGSAAYDFIYV